MKMLTETESQGINQFQSCRMNRHVKKRWLVALRSGKYVQGHRYLRVGEQYCCLGVLCDLYDSDGWKSIPQKDLVTIVGRRDDALLDIFSYRKPNSCSTMEHRTYLPVDVMRWAGIEESSALYNGGKDSLAFANDCGMTFAQIADLIEKYF